MNSLKQLWSRLNLLSSRVGKIGDSTEQLQRYSFQYNIKIISLPESEMHESAFQTASLYINLFKAAGIEISNQDIDIAHRIPTRIATSGPRPIVCKFTRRIVKEQVMNAQNEVCKVSANSIGLPSSCSLENVRLFDHLTLTVSCHQQFVQINQTCSSMQTIKCGVPQGSILGPLFFILYINDLPKASKLTELLLFADDTSIFFSHSNPNYLENVLNNELLNIDVWLRCNKLSVNIKKTNYVTFSPSQRKLNHSFSLFFGGRPLIQSNVTKFLGLYLDGHLTWKYYINFVCQQIAKSIGILSRTHFSNLNRFRISSTYCSSILQIGNSRYFPS